MLNLSIRKFLKMVGIRSQRDRARGGGCARCRKDSGTESFPARMTLEVDGLKMKVIFEGAIIGLTRAWRRFTVGM